MLGWVPDVRVREAGRPRVKWTEPMYSRGEVDRAAKTFIDPSASAPERARAREVINNWRSSHAFPLNTMQVSLRSKVRAINANGVVAQRSKRLQSIRTKLERFPNMKLSQMHDLGGARAVMDSVDEVRLVEGLFLKSQHKHVLARHDDIS